MKKCQYCGMETDDSTVICPSCSGKDFFHKCDKCGTSFDGEFCPQCGLKVGTTSKKCLQCGAKYYSSACPNCGFTGAPVSKKVAVEPPENDPPKKKNTWLWVLGWIFIFPVPLTILILRNKEMNANRCIGFIALVWIIFIVLGIMIKTPDTTSEPEREIPSDEVILPSDEVILPFSAYDLEGQLYPDIVTRFQSIGLDNIELVPIEDLIIGWLTKDGEIDQVTINGDDSFYEGDNVKKDALIRITYHTFPAEDTVAETTPVTDVVTEETVTKTVTETATSANERERYTDKMVEQYISAALGLTFDSSQYDVWVDGKMVVIQFTPKGITSVAYNASELGDKSAMETWNTLVSTARQWSKDLDNAVHNDMNRPDLTVTLYYCHDLNPDNVLLMVMNGDVYYDFVNGINRLSY